MRTMLVWMLVGCATEAEDVDGCGVQPLDRRCEGPDSTGGCPSPLLENPLVCGRYEVSTDGSGTGSTAHYFLDGKHVATVWGSDVDEFCGSYELWFGEEVYCSIERPTDTGGSTR